MDTVYVVLKYFNDDEVFRGTEDECKKWILNQAFTMSNGRKIFRTWNEFDGEVYDVGNVYLLVELDKAPKTSD